MYRNTLAKCATCEVYIQISLFYKTASILGWLHGLVVGGKTFDRG